MSRLLEAVLKAVPEASGEVDVAIIGAGPVGASLALMLSNAGLKVAAFEARQALQASQQTRSIAISHGSRVCLEKAGLPWQALHATNITGVHTSHKGSFGRTVIKASDAKVPALGYVASYATLQNTLDAQVLAAANDSAVILHTGVSIEAITQTEDDATITFTSLQTSTRTHCVAKILVLADGGANLGLLPQFRASSRDYQQTALLAKIRTDTPHRGLAYERFTDAGPVALLPYGDDYSLVWIDTPDAVAALLSLDDAAFLAKLQAHFGYRAGNLLSVENRMSYPLHLRQLQQVADGRIVVIGNAAQALHPVAAQGFNLGLRDAQELAAILLQHGLGGKVAALLLEYQKGRAADSRDTIGLTNLLVDLFSPQSPPIKALRGIGLAAIDVLPTVRRQLLKKMLFGRLA